MIKRRLETALKELARKYPVVTVTGPRQSGKTTLCRSAFPGKVYVNLEPLDTRRLAIDDPRGFLKRYPDGAIIDEVQNAPDLLSYIQPLADSSAKEGMFILTGSRQFEVLETVNQTLAGRTALLRLLPFSLAELPPKLRGTANELIYTGFYPRIYDKKLDPSQALADYVATYVERDLRKIVAIKDLALFQKFLRLCAGRSAQLLNMRDLASDTGVSHTTAAAWISVLEASYVVFLLQPLHENISKRLVKTPKLYFYDVGLAAHLLGIENSAQVATHPLRGSLFENLVVAEALKNRLNAGKRNDLNFYRDSSGLEVDLVATGSGLRPLEIKSGETLNPDYFRNLEKFIKIFPSAADKAGLVYGGDDKGERNGIRYFPASELDSFLTSQET